MSIEDPKLTLLLQIIEEEYRANIQEVRPVSGGYHKTYRFLMDNQYYFMKIAEFDWDLERFGKELAFVNMIHDNNISFLVPNHINIIQKNNTLVLIESALCGVSLKQYFGKVNCEIIADQLLELHQKTEASASSWREIYYKKSIQLEHHLEILKDSIPLELYKKINDKSSYFLEIVEKPNLICTVHGDIGYGNILVNSNDGELIGFVDFEWTRQDDPITEFVNIIYSANECCHERLSIIHKYIKKSEYLNFFKRLDAYSFFHAIRRLALSINETQKKQKIINDSYSVLDYLITNDNILYWRNFE